MMIVIVMEFIQYHLNQCYYNSKDYRGPKSCNLESAVNIIYQQDHQDPNY